MNASVKVVTHAFDREEDSDSPNPLIDKVLKKQLEKAADDKLPPDMVAKVLAQAIAWQKVKHHITDKDEEFDPDAEDDR